MHVPVFRSADPLYVVIVQDTNAESILQNWVRDNKIKFVIITGNRMMLHHQQAFDQLLVMWPHSWKMLTVWDTWNRRHIYI